jgi:hypothetical protein
MFIRPMDLQVLIPKASEINRVNQIQDVQSQLQQQQFAAQFAQAVQNRQKQVPGTTETEGQHVHLNKDSRGRGGGDNKESGTEPQQQDSAEEEGGKYVNPNLGKRIDIKT